jgi:hypothetical protein
MKKRPTRVFLFFRNGGVFSPLLEPTLSGLAIDFLAVYNGRFLLGG